MRWPAEWEPHEAVWIGFPGNPVEWPTHLAEAQREVAAFADAVRDHGSGERVCLICRDAADAKTASGLAQGDIEIIIEPFGDIWLRDTGPIILADDRRREAQLFGFNGWGGKFAMAGDQDIGQRLAGRAAIGAQRHGWILEGGAIDGDGEGRLITTEQCVLNSNRNADWTRLKAENELAIALKAEAICWLDDGLQGDHTDGHVDNLARFVSAGTVVIPEADSKADPNHTIYESATYRALAKGLTVLRLPSVGRYEVDNAIVPASYMNFFIGNRVVAVPQYDAANDSLAVEQIGSLFPDRKAVGLSSRALLRGGGSFHCISQQIPAV